MMSEQQQTTMASYDPITLAILSKMMGQSDSSDKWAQLLMQMQQQQQQQFMQMLMLMISLMPKQQQESIIPAIVQLMGQNMQLSQQQMQSFMQMLQNQYQQTLQLQKEAMEKSEKKLKEELRDTLEEFADTIQLLAQSLSKPPQTKSELDQFIEQLDKFTKLKQKIDQIFYSTPELMEKYKTPEGKPDYGALILDMIGRNLGQALEVLKYKYMTDMQRSQQVLQPIPQQVQIQPVQKIETPKVETPKIQETPKVEPKPAPVKEEPLGRIITEGPSPATTEIKEAKKPPI